MTRNYFFNVRVIHKPAECRYDVELKKHWWSRWDYISCNKYSRAKPYGNRVNSQELALSYAMRDANNYAGWNVIFEKRSATAAQEPKQ